MTPKHDTHWIDSFSRVHQYLRISVTDRCSFRCRYCMPEEGITWKERDDILTFEEIERLAKIFVRHGVTKIRLTGGEPTARQDIVVLAEKLARIPGLETLSMTTNGLRLPDLAAPLKQAGVSSVNISIDSLKPEKFRFITRRDELNTVLKGIDTALETGFKPVKLNVVVMADINDDEILDFVHFVKDTSLNVRFIEFMPFKDNQWRLEKIVGYADMKAYIQEHFQLVPVLTEASSVAKDYRLAGHSGTVSFITSMTRHFCDTCNRIRLTADGFIKPCLLHPAEVSLRDAIRNGASDEDLILLIAQTIWKKPKGHEPTEILNGENNRSMIQIGG